MILDKISNADNYFDLHPLFAKSFAYLKNNDFNAIPPGEYEIEDRKIFAIVVHQEGSEQDKYILETHKKYIDIQYAYEGSFEIGWKAKSECEKINEDYNEVKDCKLYDDEYDFKMLLSSGTFAIFFPEDAHAPIPPKEKLIKVVMKVMV